MNRDVALRVFLLAIVVITIAHLCGCSSRVDKSWYIDQPNGDYSWYTIDGTAIKDVGSGGDPERVWNIDGLSSNAELFHITGFDKEDAKEKRALVFLLIQDGNKVWLLWSENQEPKLLTENGHVFGVPDGDNLKPVVVLEKDGRFYIATDFSKVHKEGKVNVIRWIF